MFIGFIVTLVIIMLITAEMSSSKIIAVGFENRIYFEKVKSTYKIEEALVNSVEVLCQRDPAYCLAAESGGVITLGVGDLNGHISSNFVNDNLLDGHYTEIEILENFSTIRLKSFVPHFSARYIYLNHYLNNQMGIPTLCVSGTKASTPACNDNRVYHDFPTSLELRAALE